MCGPIGQRSGTRDLVWRARRGTGPSVQVRFDDARPGRRRGFALDGIRQVLVAHTPDEVGDVLATVERAVADGAWVGGWVGYEAARAFDPALAVVPTDGTAFADLPLAWFAVADGRRAVDTPVDAPVDASLSGRLVGASPSGRVHLRAWEPATSAFDHARAVARVQDHIAAGDTYQVNLTFRLSADFDGSPEDLYRQLVASQSGGYGAFLDTGDWVVASASPELFFEMGDGVVTCRPMKGTASRGPTLRRDRAHRRWLAESHKNRAENVMIVDMVRNDLARVAEVGGVDVPELFTLEKYDTLWQLTSTVTARTRPGIGLVDVFAALFPSASITGAPKVSTSRIIAELEPLPRGVYCGAIGFGGPSASGPRWTFNVAIRTVTIDRRTGRAHYGTGGGITIDSNPADEHAEAMLKAEVLQRRSGSLHLLETMRWDPGEGIRHRTAHMARLVDSAEYFDVPVDPEVVMAAVDGAVDEAVIGGRRRARLVDADGRGLQESLRIRLLVDRTGGPTVDITLLDDDPGHRGPGPPSPSAPSLVLEVDSEPVDPDDPWRHHKTTIRSAYDEAAARHPEADDVVLVNDRGEATETTIGNLVVLLDGRWVTPPVPCGLLAGTERAARLAAGELVERIVTVADLRRATALGRLNAVRGWERARLR